MGKCERKVDLDKYRYYDEKFGKWVTSRFSQEDDSEVIENIINTAINVL